MILLPDIELMIDGQRHLLSIQEPFTLDGYLITGTNAMGMEFSYHAYPNGRIAIKNENNCCVELRMDEVNYYFTREMDNFIYRYGRNARVEGRRDIGDWNEYSFSKYIREINEQCDRIRNARSYSFDYSNNNYLNALRTDLRRQGREYFEYFEPSRVNRNRYVDDYSRHYGYSVADVFSALGNWSRIGVVNNPFNNSRKYIHDYNYKPEYIKHYMVDEDKDTTLLLGAEIEVAGNDKEPNRDDVVKKCIQIINGSDSDVEDLIYSTSDSTVQIELDTMPCSIEFHKNKMNYKELFKYLDELGYKGHDCDKAGLHIHACRSYLGKSELVQQLTISKILYIIEKFNDEICVIARRNNNYSKFVGKEEVNQSLDKLYGKYIDNGKKVALNLLHKDTIEFRMFRSTLKYETFILTLEFVKNIIDFAKSINIEEIELIKWSDLMNTFSDELKEYYNDRLEKENRKKEEPKKEKNVDNTSSNVMNWSTGTISTSGLRANTIFYDEPISRDITDEYGEWMYDTITQRGLEYLAEEWNRQTNGYNSNKTTEENLKDKIKSLKKKLKNSNNFMEKKNLEKELNETQKELKKEKKKNKLNNNTER